MDPRTAHGRRDELVLIDVRESEEWRAGRIQGARHIPLRQLPRRLRELERGTPIVTVCRSGNRSRLAAMLLRARGFDAHNLSGGVKAWAAAGLQLIDPDGRPGRIA
jgi:rhodanese-related sulfurtransferase